MLTNGFKGPIKRTFFPFQRAPVFVQMISTQFYNIVPPPKLFPACRDAPLFKKMREEAGVPLFWVF